MKKFGVGEFGSLFCLLSILIVEVQSQTCVINGIDLSPLTIQPGGTYYAAIYTNGDIFTWNICAPVVSQCTLNGTSVCMLSAGKYWSCGVYSSQTLSIYNSTTILDEYTEGTICTGFEGHPMFSTQIQLVCSSDAVPVTSVISEGSCTVTLQMKTMYACSTPPTPSPSPTQFNTGFNPCNAIKVYTLPSVLSNNLAYGIPYNSDCLQKSSQNSQFYYYVPSLSRVLNVTTCGYTSMDTIINVYISTNCQDLGECIASNDDGCVYPWKSQSKLSLEVLTGIPYYFEVRTSGTSPPSTYSISFS